MVMPEDKKASWEKRKEELRQANPLHLLGKENRVDEETANKRYKICIECPELIQSTKQCKKCGCFMKVKTKLKGASCPIGKWGKVE